MAIISDQQGVCFNFVDTLIITCGLLVLADANMRITRIEIFLRCLSILGIDWAELAPPREISALRFPCLSICHLAYSLSEIYIIPIPEGVLECEGFGVLAPSECIIVCICCFCRLCCFCSDGQGGLA